MPSPPQREHCNPQLHGANRGSIGKSKPPQSSSSSSGSGEGGPESDKPPRGGDAIIISAHVASAPTLFDDPGLPGGWTQTRHSRASWGDLPTAVEGRDAAGGGIPYDSFG